MSSNENKEPLESDQNGTLLEKGEETEGKKKGGDYSDQANIDSECERLLRNTKKQVKQMMEEAVTKKFIHEESSSIISICVAIDACLSHGLKRRALGLFKTSSSTALVQKVAKCCPTAQEVLDMVEEEEKRMLSEQQEISKKQEQANNVRRASTIQRSPVKQVASNLNVHRRNLWIKCALIEKKLVDIVEHLAENAAKYYEPDALMSNYLCAQIFSSLLVGPSALEFSRSKTNDYYQFDDPSADELLKRHKLANPIACLCNNNNNTIGRHNQLSRSITDGNDEKMSKFHPTKEIHNSLSVASGASLIKSGPESAAGADSSGCRPTSPRDQQIVAGKKEKRRKPLALKTSLKRGTLITDCHHYDCQEITEHQRTRGYSFLCTNSNGIASNGQISNNTTNSNNNHNHHHFQQQNSSPTQLSHNCQINCNSEFWSLWSPRMLHETLHQNSRSCLLYAKNNVLLETQPHQFMAGYLSLHQTNLDLILKWIPNQMINGTNVENKPPNNLDGQEERLSVERGDELQQVAHSANQMEEKATVTVESSYLDYVVNLSVSQIVLLHCQFSYCSVMKNNCEKGLKGAEEESGEKNRRAEEKEEQTEEDIEPSDKKNCSFEETLILVELDGVQRAPFKFPKGGLRLFLSCLETGLRPNKYLDPAIRFDDAWLDPLQPESPVNEPSVSRFDVLLRRLPSLKRSPRVSESNTNNEQERTTSPDSIALTNKTTFQYLASPKSSNSVNMPTNNFVYRIVSAQQPDWPLQTPPHSALSVGSSSSGHSLIINGSTSARQSNATQRFRWSLSRLARLSSRYKKSGSTSSSSAPVTGASNDSPQTMENSSLCDNNSLEHLTIVSSGGEGKSSTAGPAKNYNSQHHENDIDLARIEVKLDELKRSTSSDLLALRTQSLQTLCVTMRKQILARAFYGWLAHCRRIKLVRLHLTKLIEGPDFKQSSIVQYELYKMGLTREIWNSLMDDTKTRDRKEEELSREIKLFIYHGGIESDELRKEVWPYLLDHYKFKDTQEMKKARDEVIRESYEACGCDWIKIERVVKQRDCEILAANIAKASKIKKQSKELEADQKNNNVKSDFESGSTSTQPLSISDRRVDELNDEKQSLSSSVGTYKEENQSDGQVSNLSESNCNRRIRKGKDVKLNNNKRRRRRPRLESTGSVGSDASITDQFGNNIHRIDKDVQRCDRNFWYFKDVKNLDKLRNIMCSYVWQHLDVGYVQGMCDLAAPLLVIFDDELLAFSCFSQLMKRMVANFPHGNAMDQHLESLKYLMQVLDPKLFEILQNNGDYTHFYFCYRWLLLDFKRELVYEDVYRVWETIWSARSTISNHFVVFMTLAMVRYYRDIIIENNMDFTDTIKFFNEMAERHNAEKIIALARECIVELQDLIRLSQKVKLESYDSEE